MSTVEFALPASAALEHADALVAAARELPADGVLLVDTSGVETVEGAVVLTLATLAERLPETGGSLAVMKPTAAFVDAFSDLGLFGSLMKMEFRQ